MKLVVWFVGAENVPKGLPELKLFTVHCREEPEGEAVILLMVLPWQTSVVEMEMVGSGVELMVIDWEAVKAPQIPPSVTVTEITVVPDVM